MKPNDAVAENLLKLNYYNTSQIQLDEVYVQSYKFLETLIRYKHQSDRL